MKVWDKLSVTLKEILRATSIIRKISHISLSSFIFARPNVLLCRPYFLSMLPHHLNLQSLQYKVTSFGFCFERLNASLACFIKLKRLSNHVSCLFLFNQPLVIKPGITMDSVEFAFLQYKKLFHCLY